MIKKVPRFNPKEFVVIRSIVTKLNSIFRTNHFFPDEQIKPFVGAWTEESKWLIACSDHFTWSDDKRFKIIKQKIQQQSTVEFEFVFDTKLIGKQKILVHQTNNFSE